MLVVGADGCGGVRDGRRVGDLLDRFEALPVDDEGTGVGVAGHVEAQVAVVGQFRSPVDLDLEDQRAGLGEVPRSGPVADLDALPAVFGDVLASHVDLRVPVLVVLAVGHHRLPVGVEADLDVVVDDAAVHRHGVHRVALGAGDGQRFGGIRAVAPADQIGGLGVGDGVAGGGYAGFAPHPHHVVVAVGAESRLSGVGIALTLTV